MKVEWKNIHNIMFSKELLNLTDLLQTTFKKYIEAETNKIFKMAENLNKLNQNNKDQNKKEENC